MVRASKFILGLIIGTSLVVGCSEENDEMGAKSVVNTWRVSQYCEYDRTTLWTCEDARATGISNLYRVNANGSIDSVSGSEPCKITGGRYKCQKESGRIVNDGANRFIMEASSGKFRTHFERVDKDVFTQAKITYDSMRAKAEIDLHQLVGKTLVMTKEIVRRVFEDGTKETTENDSKDIQDYYEYEDEKGIKHKTYIPKEIDVNSTNRIGINKKFDSFSSLVLNVLPDGRERMELEAYLRFTNGQLNREFMNGIGYIDLSQFFEEGIVKLTQIFSTHKNDGKIIGTHEQIRVYRVQ